MKIRKLLRNERGDMTVAAVFLILILNILIAFLLLFCTVQIQCTNIRSSVKMELNNLSAVIAEDTYDAMREGNLREYETICKSYRYRNQLTQLFRDNLAVSLNKSTEDYTITNEQITVRRLSDRMEFVYTCSVQFRVSMFGEEYPVYSRRISLTGYHITKF